MVASPGHDVAEGTQIPLAQWVEQQTARDIDVSGQHLGHERSSALGDADQGGALIIGAVPPLDEPGFLQKPGLMRQSAAAVDDPVGEFGHGQRFVGVDEFGQQLELHVAEISLGAQLLRDRVLEQADGLHQREVRV